MEEQRNVLGGPLLACCLQPMTGFFRDGLCRTHATDLGEHTVCAIVTEEFLEYSKATGNDLSTPRPEFDFPGLKAGDGWCVCAKRWVQAERAGKAPRLKLEACHESLLEHVELHVLQRYALQ